MKKIILFILFLLYSCAPKPEEMHGYKKNESVNIFDWIEKERIEMYLESRKRIEREKTDSICLSIRANSVKNYYKTINSSLIPDSLTDNAVKVYQIIKGINDEKIRSVMIDTLTHVTK